MGHDHQLVPSFPPFNARISTMTTAHGTSALTLDKPDISEFLLDQDEVAFFRLLTKIDNEDELKAHILGVRQRAYEVFNYYCIYKFAFVRLKISRLPGYREALKLLRTQEDPILLDIGCCFGNDVRKAVVDGWPVDKVVASDIRKEFWDYGHELFLSTPETFPAKFIAGDVFSPTTLQPRGPFITDKEIAAVLSRPVPSLSDLDSLTPLQGKISAIHASAFFHLFSEEEQLALARLLASLLRPEQGSVIFGQHGGRLEKGTRPRNRGPSVNPMFCHSPESWKDMWLSEVFAGDGGTGHKRIKVDAELLEIDRNDLFHGTDADPKFYAMNWCVTRL